MRHCKRGRKLGRNPSHQRALLRNLASALFLTERPVRKGEKGPRVKGRIITTLAKAKAVRPLVERCIAIACQALPAQEAADSLEPHADRQSEQWRAWRQSEQWQEWSRVVAPAVAARRRALRLLGNKEAVRLLFEEIAPRFVDRNGGYTRILRLANPRVGDAGPRAILELVGIRDRVRKKKAIRPVFEVEPSATSVDQPASSSAPSPAATEPATAAESTPDTSNRRE
jgi:large subunit ribosomal protein L17